MSAGAAALVASIVLPLGSFWTDRGPQCEVSGGALWGTTPVCNGKEHVQAVRLDRAVVGKELYRIRAS